MVEPTANQLQKNIDDTNDYPRENFLEAYKNRNRILFEVASACSKLVGIEKFELLVPGRETEEQVSVIKEESGVIKLRKARKHRREPNLVIPLIDPTSKRLGELHFYGVVNDRDRVFLNFFERWATACVYFSQLYRRHENANGHTVAPPTTPSPSPEDSEFIARQRRLNAFLLEVVRSLFHDIEKTQLLITKVLSFAQKLVDADRASLFFLDMRTNELYSRIFDNQGDDDPKVAIVEDGIKEIRFPTSRGIAGYVARTGEGVNIANAYEDARFNPEVDSQTGYHTTSVLCMPIFIRKTVMGVMQMVNKRNGGRFTAVDEEAFETFAVYCGLALHHAKLYDKIRRSEIKHRIAMEVLSYHGVCNQDEVNKLKKAVPQTESLRLMENFDFNGHALDHVEKPLYAVYMFDTLFRDKFKYARDDLIRFVLTVRKNYRVVPYHNWTHGWTVAHAIFVVLRKTNIFTPLESLALYVSCICHDLDHRGKNNAYMKTMSTPLAMIYSTSVMEHHHFNQTVTILQQEGHNILQSLSKEEYQECLGLIKHCILATDLALFFQNKAQLGSILKEGHFDWNEEQHRSLSKAVLMTTCDLIATAKPWPVQIETVSVIFQEFYDQGDAERKNGRTPMAMMDRDKANELPDLQVGFIQGICLQCFELIAKIIPETQILVDRSYQNLNRWKEMSEENKRKKEQEAIADGTENGV
uniref:Phosphodiesterase n=1 Tax=Panagrellus redivivus TaxID=6233 RepID=A0A7E4W7Z7_PANRE